MIILHAAFLGDKFHLWGESPASGPEPSGRRKNRVSAESDTPLSPYDSGRSAIVSRLAEAGVDISAGGKKQTTLSILLPSTDSGPLASSPLIAPAPDAAQEAALKEWKVNSISLKPVDAIDLLSRCAGKEMLAPGLAVGKDLRYWVAAMQFGAGLVVRQQFLPDLVQNETKLKGGFRAVWEPVLSGADYDRVLKFSSAMPDLCRASLFEADSDHPLDAARLLKDFIAFVVDYLVRSAHSTQPLIASPPIPANSGSIHDRWLKALVSDDGMLTWSREECERFAHQIVEWRRPVIITSSAPFRLCFRLEEPNGAESQSGDLSNSTDDAIASNGRDWTLRYLLQDVNDPSLLIPAESAWKSRGPRASLFKKRGFNAPEYLLSALGAASNLCPPIEESLRMPAPDGCDLDLTRAHRFLTEEAWLLEQAGFTLLLPAWWTRKGTKGRLSARASVKSPKLHGAAQLSLTEIIRFDWQVSLGGETLSLAELKMLAKLKTPLVKFRGQWVQLNADEIEAALSFWKGRSEGKASIRDLVRMSLGAGDAKGGIPVESVSADGWIGDLLAGIQGRASYEEKAAPKDLKAVLRPYQLRGYSWLKFLRTWGLGAGLADDMGLGKTVQVLALIQRDREEGANRPVLVICPTSVVSNWEKEAARFTPRLSVMVHHGIGRRKGDTFSKEAQRHAIVISSYALLHRDIEALNAVEWEGVVLDEAQNIKNAETKQSKAARSLNSGYRLALTGTPVGNKVGDFGPLLEFLTAGFLGCQGESKRTFFLPIQTASDPSAANRLRKLTEPFILRRLKTDKTIISDLPDKMEMKVFCNLTKEQASLYAAVVEETARALEKSEGIQRKGLVLATLSKLKQVCNHPAQFLGANSSMPNRSGKLARLTETLEEVLENDDRALVFSQFSEMGEIIRKHLEENFGREVLFLHGAVAKKNRDRMVERFKDEKQGPPIFILSLKAGGTGLNLTRANHVFHFERWWNPAVENQATDRAFRIGQVKNVQVHKYLCAGTLEEKIDEMIERKRGIASSVVGTGEQWLTELSTDELKELFALSKNAVAD